jgi:hypothetical protein
MSGHESLRAARDYIESRRQPHVWPKLYSGCCVNCDNQRKREAACLLCGQAYPGDTARCDDAEADAALAALGAAA